MHCKAGIPSRWAGYVPAMRWTGKRDDGTAQWSSVLWRFPENVRPQVDALGKFRGQVVPVDRLPDTATSLRVELKEVQKPQLVPPSFDVRATLMKIWRDGAAVEPPAMTTDHPNDELTSAEIGKRNARRGKGGA
jgi:hypothetical protein